MPDLIGLAQRRIWPPPATTVPLAQKPLTSSPNQSEIWPMRMTPLVTEQCNVWRLRIKEIESRLHILRNPEQ